MNLTRRGVAVSPGMRLGAHADGRAGDTAGGSWHRKRGFLFRPWAGWTAAAQAFIHLETCDGRQESE